MQIMGKSKLLRVRTVITRVDNEMREALDRGCSRNRTSVAEYIRRAVLSQLREEGLLDEDDDDDDQRAAP